MDYQDFVQVEEVSGGRKAEGSSEGEATLVVCFPPLEAWLTSRPASTAASEPGSELSSMMGSGDEIISMTGPLAEDLVVQGNNGVSSNMADAHESLPNTVVATLLSGAATQLTPSTIQPIVVQLSIQDRPSVSGPPLISMSLAAPTATPLLPIIVS